MSRQFKRNYSLTLSGSDNVKLIRDLRVVFEVTKSLRSYPNLAKIDIYNPNEKTIATATTEDPLIILNAGYDGRVGLIFKGKIRNVFINKLGTDRILTIYAGDGERNWQNGVFNKTLSGTINIGDTIKDLFDTLVEHGDLAIGQIEGLNIPANKLLGQTLSGASKDILDVLAEDYDFTWSIQDGELIAIQGEGNHTESLTAALIKQSTGMIGSPTLTYIGANVTTLLNPELLPNRLFKIESESTEIAIAGIQFKKLKRTVAEGLYSIYEVAFTGDTHTNQWFSTAKGTIAKNV